MYKEFEGIHLRFSTTPAYKRDSKFSIVHYAGLVTYSTITFVEKNKDELPKEADHLLRGSTQLLFLNNNNNNNDNSTQTQSQQQQIGDINTNKLSTNKLVSVSTQFKEQLSLLMEKIYSTSPHYIRW